MLAWDLEFGRHLISRGPGWVVVGAEGAVICQEGVGKVLGQRRWPVMVWGLEEAIVGSE